MFCMSCGVSLAGLADASQPVQPQGQPEQPIEADTVSDAHAQAEQEPTHLSGAQAEQEPMHLSDVEDVQPVSGPTETTACVSETESSLEPVEPEASLEPQPAVDPEPEAELAVVQPAAPVCPSCGKPTRETDRFCMYCGQRL